MDGTLRPDELGMTSWFHRESGVTGLIVLHPGTEAFFPVEKQRSKRRADLDGWTLQESWRVGFGELRKEIREPSTDGFPCTCPFQEMFGDFPSFLLGI